MSDQRDEEIIAICKAMTVHENSGDEEALAFYARLLAPDFRIRRLTGVQNKVEFINALPGGAGTLRVMEADPEVLYYDDVAVASLVIATTPRGPDGGQSPGAKPDRIRNLRIFRRRRDAELVVEGWILGIWHNSRIIS
jgi:hypothetical protein